MKVNCINYSDLLTALQNDMGEVCRYTARVIFVNDLDNYKRLIGHLSDIADVTLKISDEAFCTSSDVVPKIDNVRIFLDVHKNENILIPSLGEYLRFAQKIEEATPKIFSLIHREVHSDKRVWIPVFCAKDIFQKVVGELEVERFGDYVFELHEPPAFFEAFAYSDVFSSSLSNLNAIGIRAWLKLWDDNEIKNKMSFCTKNRNLVNLLSETQGVYTLHKISNPYEFVVNNIHDSTVKIDPSYGSSKQWVCLVPYLSLVKDDHSAETLLMKALNVVEFEPYQILSLWHNKSDADDFRKWIFWLWYRLGLNKKTDYLSFCIAKAKSPADIQRNIETDILYCFDNNEFDKWLAERQNALEALAVMELSDFFWLRYNEIDNDRNRLKVLTQKTHKERIEIIKIISSMLNNGKKISDFKILLMEKFPSLLVYLTDTRSLDDITAAYVQKYKAMKIQDVFDLTISDMAKEFDIFAFEPRAVVLNQIKHKKDAFYYWIDGMGIEWIDLLLYNLQILSPNIQQPDVKIGCAVIPTTTKANMAAVDIDTKNIKFDDLDSLGHIKDRSDCNYFSIVDKQFTLIESIAKSIIELMKTHPRQDIVITADHGMSRMAAKAFHCMKSNTPPKNAEVCNLGRFCTVSNGTNIETFYTYKENNVIAFRNHQHFTSSGNAPGEIHGGATPEECLVPIITIFNSSKQSESFKSQSVTYNIEGSVKLDVHGMANIFIDTSGKVDSVEIEISGNTFIGNSIGKGQWSVSVPDLKSGETYDAFVYLNNCYPDHADTVIVQRRGLTIDDEFL